MRLYLRCRRAQSSSHFKSTVYDYFVFYVPLKFTYEDVTITGEGLQNLGLCSALWALEHGRDLYRATPAMTWDFGFSGLIRRTTPFNRILRLARVCRGPFLTRILTGL
jgi:hypothetical protein